MTNNRNQKTKKIFLSLLTDTITVGANEGFACYLADFHYICENIDVGDGAVCRPSHIEMFLQTSPTVIDEPYFIVPVIVQTNGTWTSNDNISHTSGIENMLAGTIDDVLGYYAYPPRNSRRKPVSTIAGATGSNCSEGTLIVPQHLIALLRKEIATERLQSLKFGFVGIGANTQVLQVRCLLTIKYDEVRRSIAIR
jgi:hypothetical protein